MPNTEYKNQNTHAMITKEMCGSHSLHQAQHKCMRESRSYGKILNIRALLDTDANNSRISTDYAKTNIIEIIPIQEH